MSEPARSIGGRPTRKAAAALDAHIVAVASAIFIERGYGGASMTAIAAEARIGKQTLYRRYRDKVALFRAAVNARIATASGMPEISRAETDPIAELRMVARSALEAVSDAGLIAFHRILISEVGSFQELAALASQWGSQHIERCAAAIARASQSGLPIPGDPVLVATSFLWSVVGDAFYRILMGERLLGSRVERDRFFEAKWSVTIFGGLLTSQRAHPV